MNKFKLTQTAAEVQGILNNSLQKPTGLTKTKLVGVGVNGQENIEIGDNLTLANGKLSAAMGGGSTAPARHVYDVIINGTCQYTAYTTKDLNLPIGEQTQINDFATNDEYKELRKIGKYFANGYFELPGAKKRLVFDFEFYSANYYRVWGTYTVSDGKINLELEYCDPTSWQITKRI